MSNKVEIKIEVRNGKIYFVKCVFNTSNSYN